MLAAEMRHRLFQTFFVTKMLTILVLSQTGKVKGCSFFRILVRTFMVQVKVKSSFVNEASGESEVMSTERSLSAAK